MEKAKAIFKLNIEMYPGDANAYDSYGEALMLNGEYELAIQNYEKSLELDPDNGGAKLKLKELYKLVDN